MNLTRRKILKLFALAPVALTVPLPTPKKVLLSPGYVIYNAGRKKLYFSQAALDDIRGWGVNEIDEATRREIYGCGDIERTIGVSIHE